VKLRLGLAPPFGRIATGWLWLALLVPIALAYGQLNGFAGTEGQFLIRQDLPVFALCILTVALIGWTPRAWLARGAVLTGFAPAAWPLLLAAVVAIAGAAGVWLVFGGYTLSLDEFLADFDARIFAHGAPMAPLDPAWRAYAPALEPMYILPVPHHDFWVSGYLPVNAAFRALAGQAGAAWLLNPLLSGFSVIATWAIGRRLWPDRPGLGLAAAALLGGSAQLILMGMTAYAMPAHLALNLAWLWLFLRGGRLGHAGAMLAGFLASGLHQLIFHPLFAAPFVLQLWLDRRWRLAGLYTLAYAAIGLFWTEYWRIALALLGEANGGGSAAGGWILDRALAALGQIRIGYPGAMAESLVRFVTWQNPLTAPLALLGTAAAIGAKGHLRALALGVCLTLLAMQLLEPTQTHGWGYRYAHGLLGSICLIAAWTWARLTDALDAEARAVARGGFVAACAVSLLVLTPIRAWQAWSYARPYAAAYALIRSAPEPVVIVDDREPWFDAGTVVRNDPFLVGRPTVLMLSGLDETEVRDFCRGGPVGFFDGRQAGALGAETVDVYVDPKLPRLRSLMARLGCGRPLRTG
jgi:hypothetical protein